jgi:CRISPR-associated protein Csy2
LNHKQRTVAGYLVFKEIEIEGANALSGNLIYGTPAITGIKGAFHAMSRKLLTNKKTAHLEASLRGVMIACHECRVNASRAETFREYHFIQQKPAPTTSGDLAKMKVGTLPSIIQQAQCYVKMSFVVEVVSNKKLTDDDKALLTQEAFKLIQQNRLAGGNVCQFNDKQAVKFINVVDLNSLPYDLTNCNILVDANDVMQALIQKNPTMSATDILIDVASVHHTPVSSSNGTQWRSSRIANQYGWVVPITVGHHGINPVFKAGVLENSRSNQVESQYVESVYSLGRWVNLHKLQLESKLSTAFWYYNHDVDASLYLVSSRPPL